MSYSAFEWRYTDLEYQVMTLSIGSKLINGSEDRTLLLEGTGHVVKSHKPLHQCSDAQLAMVLQTWRCRAVYGRCSKNLWDATTDSQVATPNLLLCYGCPMFTDCAKVPAQSTHC